ncbi:MAG: peptidoglycan DD-metalloendopeptidase family protein [Methyloglobulus sp.]|nr:peptidoglycan DD-metalloendopeptidase family protein [Methyloglobulus sp.]
MKNKLFIVIQFICLCYLLGRAGFVGAVTKEDMARVAGVLFNGKGTNYSYNPWGACPNNWCYIKKPGYDGGHSGHDIQTQTKGTDTFHAVSNGEVIKAQGSGTIAIYDNNKDITVLYLHASSHQVSIGDQVKVGDAIGNQGDVGASGAFHVHLEARNGRHENAGYGAKDTIEPIAIALSYINASPVVVKLTCQDKYCWTPENVSCEQATKWFEVSQDSVAYANFSSVIERDSSMCSVKDNYLNFISQKTDCQKNIPENFFSQAWWRSLIHKFLNVESACAASAIKNHKVSITINSNTKKLVAGNGTYSIDSAGQGYAAPATEPAYIGQPDFVTQWVKLYNLSGGETYQYKAADTITMKGSFDNIGAEDCPGDNKVIVHFYLSKGYKEDAHSDWRRVGTDDIKCYNIEPNDSPKEEVESFRSGDKGLTPGFYNIVACADHPLDDHNNGGDYAEEHESNNCSTEAVFQVVTDTVTLQPVETPPLTSAQLSAVMRVINSLLLDDDPCTYALTPTAKTVNNGSSTQTVNVAVTDSECPWNLGINGTLFTNLSSGSGTTSETVQYSVSPNPLYTKRVGKITLTSLTDSSVSKVLTVTQLAKPGVSVANVSMSEGAAGKTKLMTFQIKLNRAATTTVNVSYATQNGTAIAGTDYVAKSGTVSFAAGQIAKNVTVTIKGDATKEVNETFNFVLSAPTVPYTLQRAKAIGTITNDD